MNSKIETIYIKHDAMRVCQGDILRDFEYQTDFVVKQKGNGIESKSLIGKKWKIPYMVILTQDCDLEWDFRAHETESESQDKFLHTVLICPAYLASEVKKGAHLSSLNLKMGILGGDLWKNIEKNQNSRYFYLPSNLDLQIPELVLDFKHCYAISRDLLYSKVKEHYLATVNELFREFLSQKFAAYLSRIGLPFPFAKQIPQIDLQ